MDHEQVLSFQSLDDERPGHPGGRKPLPLKSSWMMRDRQITPPREPVTIFFLDDLSSDTTVARAADIDTAVECMVTLAKQGIRTYIRTFVLCEESYEEDKRLKRWKAQMSV